MSKITRRKFLNITAISLALPFYSNSLFANTQNKLLWEGITLGSQANMTLFHNNINFARNTLNICINEIIRLEKIFSLFDENSSISQLNKNSYLKNPPKELVEILNFANTISENTNGAFDVSVQPLWLIHAKFFKDINNKDIFVVNVNDELFIKQIIYQDDLFTLKSFNCDYKDINVKADELVVIGRVKGVLNKI